MTTPKLIGITGRAGAGKDTLAEMLDMAFFRMHKPKSTSIKSFAAPLKTATATLFDLSHQHMVDRFLKETPLPEHDGLSPRQLLQRLGSAIRNEFGGRPFINLMRNRITESADDVIIIPDVRYQNEAEFILSYPDSILVVVTRPSLECRTTSSSHESEHGLCIPDLKSPDRIIHVSNDGDLKQLSNLAGVLAARYE